MSITKLVHNVSTGEVLEIELNEEELKQRALDIKAEDDRLNTEAEKAAQKQALLNRLGITEDEAKLLLS
jgi:hypothetical protein